MEEKRKPRPWLMWLAVGMALLVLYPLSWGPVVWLNWNGWMPRPVLRVLQVVYAPVIWLWYDSPEPFQSAFRQYMKLWQ